MSISYSAMASFELWVNDWGSLDTLGICLNGRLIDFFADHKTHRFQMSGRQLGPTL